MCCRDHLRHRTVLKCKHRYVHPPSLQDREHLLLLAEAALVVNYRSNGCTRPLWGLNYSTRNLNSESKCGRLNDAWLCYCSLNDELWAAREVSPPAGSLRGGGAAGPGRGRGHVSAPDTVRGVGSGTPSSRYRTALPRPGTTSPGNRMPALEPLAAALANPPAAAAGSGRSGGGRV